MKNNSISNLENRENQLIKQKQLIYYTIITLIFFGGLYKLEYATDTYQVFNFTSKELFWQFASNGRFVTAFIGSLIKTINLSEKSIYLSSYILAIICTILSQKKLYQIVKKDVKNRVLQIIIPTLIIINPFSIELFLFIEKGIMLFGVLMCIYALSNLTKFWEIKSEREKEKNKDLKEKNLGNVRNKRKILSKSINIIYATIFMLIANCCYQGIVGIFVATALIYIIKYSQNIKQFILNNLLVASIYGVPALINYLMVKIIYKGSRVNGEIIIYESIKKIGKSTLKIATNMFEIFPKYTYILIILFTFGILCYTIWKGNKAKNSENDKKENTIKLNNENVFRVEEKNDIKLNNKKVNIAIEVLKILYIIVGTAIVTIAPQFLQSTSSIWFVPRSTYAFASLYGILVLYLLIKFAIMQNSRLNIEKEENFNKAKQPIAMHLDNLIIIISICLLIMQLNKFYIIEQDRYLLNQKDYEVTQQIIEKVEKYENKTGNRISQIAIYTDSNPNYS